MKKRWLLLGLVCAIVVTAILCLTGRWIPNEVIAKRYLVRGIDISAHQGAINWKAVAGSGIAFAYLKATEGGDFQDARFKENLEGATAAGIRWGAYHFFSLKSSGEAQAQNFIKVVPHNQLGLPPAIDLEYVGNSSERPPKDHLTNQLQIFVKRISEEYGCEPIIYAGDDFAKDYLNNFPIKRVWARNVLTGPPAQSWIFWQYSEFKRVGGINGPVDADVFAGKLEDFPDLLHQ